MMVLFVFQGGELASSGFRRVSRMSLSARWFCGECGTSKRRGVSMFSNNLDWTSFFSSRRHVVHGLLDSKKVWPARIGLGIYQGKPTRIRRIKADIVSNRVDLKHVGIRATYLYVYDNSSWDRLRHFPDYRPRFMTLMGLQISHWQQMKNWFGVPLN